MSETSDEELLAAFPQNTREDVAAFRRAAERSARC
jgi:uncharacterized protein (DUF433 family)